MTHNTNSSNPHLKAAYTYISIILFAPVLLWPIPLVIFDKPMLTDIIIPKWHLSIIILLITSIVMDTFLSHVKSHNHAIYITALFFIAILIITQNANNSWTLALFFLLHSIRSSYQLIMKPTKSNNQMLWIAWKRDLLTATTILLWESNLAQL